MKKINLLWVVLLGLLWTLQAEAQCPGCTINLPPGIPADTVVIDSIPDAYKNAYYEEVLTYRLPYTTDPLAALAPPGTVIPLGQNVDYFKVVSVTGLPPGLSWIGDRPQPLVYNETPPQTRDGCITLCGTPGVAGTFTVNVNLEVSILTLVVPTPPIPIEFVVLPDTNAPFLIDTASGCAPHTITITNRVTSGGNPDISYFWDFGNGLTSVAEQPGDVTYDFGLSVDTTVGVYQRVIIDTFPHLLESIVVTADPSNSCNDDIPFFPGAPDMYIILIGNGDTVNTDPNFALIGNTQNNEYAPDTMVFPGPLVLADGQSYSLEIWDDDSAVPFDNDDPCGSGPVTFSSALGAGTHVLTTGSMTIEIVLSNIVDTVEYVDSVTVEFCDISVDQLASLNRTLQVFPNPTQDLVNVRFQLPRLGDDVELTMTDLLGRTVYSEYLGKFQGTYDNAIDLSGQPNGIYVLRMRVGDQLLARKVVLQQ